MALSISLLGPPRVERDGEPVAFDTRKAMALLAHLALAERPRSREALTELLWPGRESEHARGALRRTLSTLRKSIGPERVHTTGSAIALPRAPDVQVDVARFRELLADDPPDERALSEAIELSRGAFMEGFSLRDSPEFDHWQIAEADALRRELAAALSRLVELVAARGDFPKAIGHARHWLALDALHEPAHRQLVRLYAWNGDRAAALAQYRDCVRTLSRELGVAPLAETTALYEQVNDGTIAPPAAGPASRATARRTTAAPAPSLPLVGRSDELAALLDLHAGIEDDGRLAVIEGEPGIGKTRLAAELLERTSELGARILTARCHEDEVAIPYGPVVDLLRAAARREGSWPETVAAASLAEAARLTPELSDLRQDAVVEPADDQPGASARLLEGVCDVLTAASRGATSGVLVVDDVHAADEATLDSIAYLARRLRSRPLLLLLTWRTEDVPPGHRLRRLVAELGDAGACLVVRPRRLDSAEVAELVRAAAPWAEAAEPDRAFLESEGLPLFVAEYLAAVGSGEDLGEVSGGVRELLRARLRPLGETARQVLGAAAAIGRSFDLETVRTASGRGDEETVDAIEELASHGLVVETGDATRYDFSHGRLRTLVYEDTSLARRRLLHRRGAEALAGAAHADPAVIAHHYRLGGRDAEAAEHHLLAAVGASSLHAHADALIHLEAALGLGHPDVAGLHERMGDHRMLLGEYTRALEAYEAAAAAGSPESLPAIEQKLAGVLHRRGEWERAEARLGAALDLVDASNPALRARIQADRSLNAHRDGRQGDAADLARSARELAEGADDARALAQAHNLIAVLARSAGDLEAAKSHLDRSAELAERIDDPHARAAALNNRALVSAQAGERERALALTREALELCVAAGDRHREAALNNNLADLLHAAGRPDESMAHLRRAVTLFSEIDADETTRQPEVWKLVDW